MSMPGVQPLIRDYKSALIKLENKFTPLSDQWERGNAQTKRDLTNSFLELARELEEFYTQYLASNRPKFLAGKSEIPKSIYGKLASIFCAVGGILDVTHSLFPDSKSQIDSLAQACGCYTNYTNLKDGFDLDPSKHLLKTREDTQQIEEAIDRANQKLDLLIAEPAPLAASQTSVPQSQMDISSDADTELKLEGDTPKQTIPSNAGGNPMLPSSTSHLSQTQDSSAAEVPEERPNRKRKAKGSEEEPAPTPTLAATRSRRNVKRPKHQSPPADSPAESKKTKPRGKGRQKAPKSESSNTPLASAKAASSSGETPTVVNQFFVFANQNPLIDPPPYEQAVESETSAAAIGVAPPATAAALTPAFAAPDASNLTPLHDFLADYDAGSSSSAATPSLSFLSTPTLANLSKKLRNTGSQSDSDDEGDMSMSHVEGGTFGEGLDPLSAAALADDSAGAFPVQSNGTELLHVEPNFGNSEAPPLSLAFPADLQNAQAGSVGFGLTELELNVAVAMDERAVLKPF